MREILFRGKCNEVGKYNGQWIEGFYGEDDGKPIIARSTDHGLIGYFCEPDSIGQYTGLTDKNGRKIFEGDILKVKQHGEMGLRTCAIYFGEYIDADSVFGDYRCIGFYLKVVDECCSIGGLLDSDFEFEIIGNIYDNPELVGGESDG